MAWTKIPKPAELTTSSGGGAEPWGFLLAITSFIGGQSTSIISGWGNVAKPTASTWTTVLKPTSSVWTTVSKPTT